MIDGAQKVSKQIVMVMLVGMLLSLSVVGGGNKSEQEGVFPVEAKLYGLVIANNQITFTVMSHGCTRAEHFSLVLLKETPITLGVNRVKRDLCRRRAEPMSVTLSLSRLPDTVVSRMERGDGFRLANQLYRLPKHLQ